MSGGGTSGAPRRRGTRAGSDAGGARAAASPLLLDGRRDLGLETTLLGRRIHWFETVDSTNSALRSLAEAGEPEGSVLVADEQTSGRGRSGRGWFSPRGAGLYFSVLLRPGLTVGEVAPLPLVVSASVADAAASFSGVAVGVKWPNDVVAGGRKLGGVLLESLQGASKIVEQVIVGVGLNVNLNAVDLPAELSSTAVSLLMLTGRRTPSRPLLRAVLAGLDEAWGRFEREGPAPSLERWRALSTTLGTEVEVSGGGETVRGKALDVSPSGALVVELSDGSSVEVWSGDITEREAADD